MRKRTIGIIGGMGPAATMLLMGRIIAATAASDDADHVPMIIDNNTQVPSRIAALIEHRGEDPGPVIAGMATRLVEHGAEALAMPCNTAHHYADLVRSTTDVPFLDMVRLSIRHLSALDGQVRRIGMLASPAVRLVGVFDEPMREAGLVPCYLDDDRPLLDIIRYVKAHGVNDDVEHQFSRQAARLSATGIDCLLVACSELSLMPPACVANVPCIDTIDILAIACRDFSCQIQTATLTNPRNSS
jgi:aspartate racemase